MRSHLKEIVRLVIEWREEESENGPKFLKLVTRKEMTKTDSRRKNVFGGKGNNL